MNPMPFTRPPPAEPPSLTSLSRAVIAQAATRLDRGSALDYAANRWPGDSNVPMVLRASVNPTLMVNAAGLQPIVASFAAAIAPLSASGALMNAGVLLTSFGRGIVTFPAFAPGESAFVAEGTPIPVKQFVASSPSLSPFKLATIVTLSAELLEHSDAERLVRVALAESVGLGIDRVMFSANAASAAAPAGLLNGVGALTAAAAGAGAMAADLAALVGAIAPVASAGFFIAASPPQAMMMQVGFVHPLTDVRGSAAIPAKTIIAIAPQALASVLEMPRVESSIEALVHEDTAPSPISTAGPIAAPTRSLFQTNAVGLRMITPCSWALRTTGAVAWITNVNW